MAPLSPTTKPRSRLSLPVIPFVPPYTSPVREHLIPKPLNTKFSRVQLSTLHEHNDIGKSQAQEPESALQSQEHEVTRENEDRKSTSGYKDRESASGDEKPVHPTLGLGRSHSLPIEYPIRELRREQEPLYGCSLCRNDILSNSHPYSFPSTYNLAHFGRDSDKARHEGTGRVFCEACWTWIYNLAICWKCGEVVGRREERVGFGWCWWHWGCLGCLVCKVIED